MLGRIAVFCCIVLVLLGVVRPADAWIENRVLGAETRIEIEASGKAVVEQRITLKTNGNERLREITIRAVDPDAEPSGQSYVIPARDALSGSLEAALPLRPERVDPPSGAREGAPEPSDQESRADLRVRVEAEGGLGRGTYLLVVRYQTDLRARGHLRRDGPLVELDWTGPRWDDGLDNARVTFILPAAPTPPRAADGSAATRELAGARGHGLAPVGTLPSEVGLVDDEAHAATRYLSEVRRGSDRDEIELLRSYAPKDKALGWTIVVDQRALDPLPMPEEPVSAESTRPGVLPFAVGPQTRPWLLAAGLALYVFFVLLVVLKGRDVRRLAVEANATIDGWVPLPLWLRALLAPSLLVAGVALQLLFQRPFAGSVAVVFSAVVMAYGTARLDPARSRRGPGRWLAVSEAEGLCLPARVKGGWLDSGTRAGRLLLFVLLAAVAVVAALLARSAAYHAVLVALDAVVLLSLFGTGRRSAFPPDLSVEPIAFLRKVVRRARRAKRAPELRMVPRIRIPADGVDPDEVRLVVVPRNPLRGLLAIEVALTYGVGLGARVGFPELLVRLNSGSDCEQAVRALARVARVTPGRQPGQVVLAFAPRLPTVHMTAELLIALASRLTSRSTSDGPNASPEHARPAPRPVGAAVAAAPRRVAA